MKTKDFFTAIWTKRWGKVIMWTGLLFFISAFISNDIFGYNPSAWIKNMFSVTTENKSILYVIDKIPHAMSFILLIVGMLKTESEPENGWGLTG